MPLHFFFVFLAVCEAVIYVVYRMILNIINFEADMF